MRLVNYKLPYDFNLFLFGDDHTGNVLHYEEGVDMLIDAMESEFLGIPPAHNFGLHHGDPFEGIFMGDYRYDPRTQRFRDTIRRQHEEAVEKYKPIRNRLFGVLDGNHSNSKHLRPFGNTTMDLCADLRVNFLTYQTVLTYIGPDDEVMFRHFAGHGWGSVNSKVKPRRRAKANREIALMGLLREKAANTMLMSMGHTHKLEVARPDQHLQLVYSDNHIKQGFTSPDNYYGDVDFIPDNLRWYANTGGFVKLYQAPPPKWAKTDEFFSGYAEMAGYDPIPLGFCVAEVRGGKIQDVKKIVPDSDKGLIILNA